MNDLSFPDFHAAHNHSAPDLYEIENLAADPEGRVEAIMASIAPWKNKVVLDLGAGTGFHVPRFCTEARHVIAVEPHGPSRLQAMERVARLGLTNVSVVTGSAEHLLLNDASVDICHSRLAYFFAPSCQAGLTELARVMRPGGTAFILDVDGEHGAFASWVRRHSAWQTVDPAQIERFWRTNGFDVMHIASEWRFKNRADMRAVITLELGPVLAQQMLQEHRSTSIEYYYCLYYRHYS